MFQDNNISVKRKLDVKSLSENCQALKGLESSLSNKEVAKNLVYLKKHFNVD